MGKIKELAIDESNLLRDIYKQAADEYYKAPRMKNEADMFMRAFIAGARSETAKEYWKFKLKLEENVENNNQQ